MAQDHAATVSTPTRFLLECGEWSLTPSLGSYSNEVNPFEYQFPTTKTTQLQWTPPSPVHDSPDSMQSPELPARNQDQNKPLSPPTPPRSTSHSPTHRENKRAGRKRRMVFEQEEQNVEQRKKFLERNRVAAFKCRQKKKQWMQDLAQQAELVTNQNKELHNLVSQLREESMFLRNQLLAHGNCDCAAVQTYIRRTSAQLTSNNTRSPSAAAAAAVVAESPQMFQFLPHRLSKPPFPPTSAHHVDCSSSSFA